ncbi:MAG: hypothetical protein ACFFAU_01615 [Candidatus Hodarchaeota archaeon]
MTKCELFEKYIYDICGKTRTKMPLIKQYKLRKYAAWCDGYTRISYHPGEIKRSNKRYLVFIAAHEVGHIRTMPKDRKEAEYLAELFALKTVWKYYRYLFSFSHTKDIISQNDKLYTESFKKAIKDFKKWRLKNK